MGHVIGIFLYPEGHSFAESDLPSHYSVALGVDFGGLGAGSSFSQPAGQGGAKALSSKDE